MTRPRAELSDGYRTTRLGVVSVVAITLVLAVGIGLVKSDEQECLAMCGDAGVSSLSHSVCECRKVGDP